MTNWKEYKLGEIGEVITGKTPSKKNPEQWGDIMPFVTPTDFDAYNKNIVGSIRYLSAEGINAFQKKVLPQDSVIVTCIGSQMGKVALNKKECVTNQQINSIIPHKEFNSDFIYYVISSMQDYLRNLATGGSTMPIVNKSTFEEITIKAPDLPTQTAIAEILSSLDDKIELNNKINQELENLAQTLFKQWFIDFEFPNEKGDPYKSSGGEMVDSELGEIPKGWEVGKYGDFTKTTSGGTPSRKKNEYYLNGNILWVKSKELNNSMFFETEEKINELGLKNSSAKLLPAYSVLIAMYGATVGQFGLITTEASCNQAICAVLPSERLPFSYNYLFFQNYRKEFENFAVGSAQQNISQELIKSIKIALPPNDLISEFHSLSVPLLNSIEINCRENQELIHLRDTLLPKLISGELEVAEVMAEKA